MLWFNGLLTSMGFLFCFEPKENTFPKVAYNKGQNNARPPPGLQVVRHHKTKVKLKEIFSTNPKGCVSAPIGVPPGTGETQLICHKRACWFLRNIGREPRKCQPLGGEWGKVGPGFWNPPGPKPPPQPPKGRPYGPMRLPRRSFDFLPYQVVSPLYSDMWA